MPVHLYPLPSYPRPRRGTAADDYHGERIFDPYRGLEDASPWTRAWVSAQNELTSGFLASIPAHEPIRQRLTELWDHLAFGVPFERGGRWFQTRNPGVADQPILYMMDAPDGAGRPLFEPGDFPAGANVTVPHAGVSPDGTMVAYAISVAGSDWRTWHVRDVATGRDLEDRIEWSRLSAASWRKDGSGFYYGAAAPGDQSGERQQESRAAGILFHRLGTAQADDDLVFAAPGPDRLPVAAVSDDGRYLIISIRRGMHPQTQVQILDLCRPAAGLQQLIADFTVSAAVVASAGETFYVLTDDHADRCRIVAIDLGRPDRAAWREIVPQARETLLGAHFYGGLLVCHYLRDANSLLRVHAPGGEHVRDIALPGLVSLAGRPLEHEAIEGSAGSDVVYFKVESFTNSGTLWRHDLRSGATSVARAGADGIDPSRFVTEQVFVTSADGTRVPMFVTRQRDLTAAGEAPVLLYGYGGFGVSVTPSFRVPWALWLERGGVLAVASLRGGGEYGRGWHRDGRRERKQNVFDDFCACARWLAESGWSRAERIAISGGSNGGLLVGACLTRHPELFGAAVADVGVFDMLRYHKFTMGWAWASDFGDPDDPAQYQWLRGYSPLHNVRPGTRYPAVLLTTGDHDDRVVPAHSLKFAAALQAAQAGDAPILLRVDSLGGHGHGKPTATAIAEATDWLAFLDAVVCGPAAR